MLTLVYFNQICYTVSNADFSTTNQSAFEYALINTILKVHPQIIALQKNCFSPDIKIEDLTWRLLNCEGGGVEKKVCIIEVETLIFAHKTDTKVMCVCVGWCRMSPAPSIYS